MSELNGDLSSFGVRRVLEFLADAGQTGELQVTSDDIEGRVLFQGGSVAYATTATGADTVAELDALLGRYQQDLSDHSLSDGDVSGEASLEAVLEDQLIEVVYRLTQVASGTFSFAATIDFSGPEEIHAITVDDLLALLDVRLDEWRKVRDVIPSSDAAYRLASRLPDGRSETTLDATTWALLAAVGGEGSVNRVADALNLYEFQTARTFADLVEDGLLEAVEATTPAADTGWAAGTELSLVQPVANPVTFSARDLSQDEMNDVIRDIGRGIYPS